MNAERVARFLTKLDHAVERLGQFAEWLPGARTHVKDRLACYKAFQEASEALADVVAMMLKDEGVPPKDDYTNLATLAERGLLTPAAAATLREMNGLRNRLVHEYGGLSDDVALRSGERLAPEALRVVEEVKAWLSSRS